MKIINTCLILLMAFSTTCLCQEIPKAEAIPFLGLEMSAVQVKKDVFAVEIAGNQSNEDKGDDWVSLGTGFFVSGKNDDRNVLHLRCLICCHVVKTPSDAKTPIFIGIEGTNQYYRVPCKVIHLDPTNDIAVLKIINLPADLRSVVSHSFLRHEIDAKPQLTEGTGLVIPGYPLGVGTQADKNHPVVRFGIVAQNLGGKHFLIDGVANHGSSGSPVVRVRDQKVVGMVTSHLADKISLLDERGQLAAQLPYNSGIARALSSEEIVSTLKKLDEEETKSVQP